jgi:hypothetical protein
LKEIVALHTKKEKKVVGLFSEKRDTLFLRKTKMYGRHDVRMTGVVV